MEQEPIKIYARLNDSGQVERFLETAHFQNEVLKTDIFIEEGYGDDYAYPQSRENDPLIPYDNEMCHNWILEGKKIRKATNEEKAAEAQARPKPPKQDIEILKEENLLLKAQIEAITEREDFVEDCIAELAMQIYQ